MAGVELPDPKQIEKNGQIALPVRIVYNKAKKLYKELKRYCYERPTIGVSLEMGKNYQWRERFL